MKIIAGLGNPGPKYETTRHNVGFLAIDRLVERWKASGPVQKSQGEVYQGSVLGEKILLVKPMTYMNLSGKCIAPLYQFYQCKPEDLIIIHDDLDLAPLNLRLKTGGSAGGHNGLKSIDECLGKTQSGYHRVRIGVGHPSRTPGLPGHISRLSAADYVLMPFTDSERADLDSLLDDVTLAVEEILQGRILQAMNRFHKKNSKQES
jgi:peptidyl-tRNA hydrolase, PTH1 family